MVDTAKALFEGLAPIHGLDAHALSLARTAAMLIDIGAPVSRAHRNVVARDLLLRQPVTGLSPDEQRTVAALDSSRSQSTRIEEVALGDDRPRGDAGAPG